MGLCAPNHDGFNKLNLRYDKESDCWRVNGIPIPNYDPDAVKFKSPQQRRIETIISRQTYSELLDLDDFVMCAEYGLSDHCTRKSLELGKLKTELFDIYFFLET